MNNSKIAPPLFVLSVILCSNSFNIIHARSRFIPRPKCAFQGLLGAAAIIGGIEGYHHATGMFRNTGTSIPNTTPQPSPTSSSSRAPGGNILCSLAGSGNEEDLATIKQLVVVHGVDIDAPNYDGNNALGTMLIRIAQDYDRHNQEYELTPHHRNIITTLLEMGANPNAPILRTEVIPGDMWLDCPTRYRRYTTPMLIYALKDCPIEIASILLDTETIDVDCTDKKGLGPLDLLPYKNHDPHASFELFKKIVHRISNINEHIGHTGANPLISVATYDEEDLSTAAVKYLLENTPINLDDQDKSGKTALMHSIKCGNSLVAHMLIDAGANTRITDNKGYSALHYADKCGSLETFLLIQQLQNQA